jgi:hypothetical protein
MVSNAGALQRLYKLKIKIEEMRNKTFPVKEESAIFYLVSNGRIASRHSQGQLAIAAAAAAAAAVTTVVVTVPAASSAVTAFAVATSVAVSVAAVGLLGGDQLAALACRQQLAPQPTSPLSPQPLVPPCRCCCCHLVPPTTTTNRLQQAQARLQAHEGVLGVAMLEEAVDEAPVLQPGLWIRVDLLRIRIQHFCSIRIRIQAKTELSKTISFSNFFEIKI